MNLKKKIYISGPMTGIKDLNIPAFNKAAASLRRKGFYVISPPELDLIERAETWEGCLKRDLRYVVDCDAIATLPRWTKSRGANLEVYVGRALKLPIHTVSWFLKKGERNV